MAIYRNVSLSFWDDNKVVDDFTIEDRYFYLYLLTNPHTNLIGCYEISLKQMANETGFDMKKVQELIDRMTNVHKVIIYSIPTKEILLRNWSKYNWTRSEKLLKNVESVSFYIKSQELKEKMGEIIQNYKDKNRVSIPYAPESVSVSDTINNIINNKLNNNKELISIFKEYINYRKDNKLSCSKTVVVDLLEFLDDYNEKQKEKIIKKSLKGGYKDFYPPNSKEIKEEVKYETVS